jgi:hypothetical protein
VEDDPKLSRFYSGFYLQGDRSTTYAERAADTKLARLRRRSPSLQGLVKVSLGVFIFMSIMIIILWKNIFQIQYYISPWLLENFGILFMITSTLLIVSALILRVRGFLHLPLSTDVWLLFGKSILNLHFRRLCPYSECGGVMESQNISNIGWRWVCRRNPQNLVEYDYTQVESAIKKGQLASEFDTVIGERYWESARRARQKRRNVFP